MTKLSSRQLEIAKAWYKFEDAEDDISIERLTAQVSDKCHASWNEVMEVMNKFSETVAHRQKQTRQSNKSAINAVLKEGQ